jgi:hypothetical protein
MNFLIEDKSNFKIVINYIYGKEFFFFFFKGHKVVNFVPFRLKHSKYFIPVLHLVQETPLKRTC